MLSNQLLTKIQCTYEYNDEIALITALCPLAEIDVQTPICTTKAKAIAGKKLAVVPILRAGI